MNMPTAIKNTYIAFDLCDTKICENNIRHAHTYATAIEHNKYILQLRDSSNNVELDIIGKTIYELLESNVIKKHHIKKREDVEIK